MGSLIFLEVPLYHSLFKSEHSVIHQVIRLYVRIVWVGMVSVEELDDMKSAAVDVEVDITLFKIRRDGLPDLHLRIHSLNLTPRGIADTFAVDMRRYKKQIQISLVTVNTDNSSACDFSVIENTVRIIPSFYSVFFIK